MTDPYEMTAEEMKRSPWARIIKASRDGKGLRLSAEDCSRLGRDDAIDTVGRQDLDGVPYDERF
jgi:hypothetical protein